MTYVNYGSVTAIGVVFPVLGMILLGLRFYGRHYFDRRIGIDDLLLIPATVLNVAAGVGMIYGAQLHLVGGHNVALSHSVSYSDEDRDIPLEKLEWAYWIEYVVAMELIRLSILFFFRRTFTIRGIPTWIDYANWGLIAIVIVWTLGCLFFTIFKCGVHFSDKWASLYANQHLCVSSWTYFLTVSISDWILDFAVFVEPIIIIYTLRMKFEKKLPILLIFGTSLFAVIAGLVRMISFIQVSSFEFDHPTITITGTTFAANDIQDITSLSLFWTYIETGVGFCIACLPPCGRVIDRLVFKPFSTKTKSLLSLNSKENV